MPCYPSHSPSVKLEAIAEFAASVADEARRMSLVWFRRPLCVESKADHSPVTIADREIETFIRKQIAHEYPDHGILGEEHGRQDINAEYVWIIDPIDGTRSFITGWPLFGSLVALLKNGEPVFGQIDAPVLKERWVGWKGAPTLFNGVAARTSGCVRLKDASIYTTSPDHFEEKNWRAFDAASRKAAVRRFGGDCYSYAMLASGFVDAVVEDTLQPYDYLSLVSIIEGAGGKITDWEGRPVGLESGARIVAAATERLHAEILNELATAID